MDLPRPRGGLWQGLLVLVANLLTCRMFQASGHIFISPDTLVGAVGYRSILILENVSENVLEYSWHRGEEGNAANMIFSYRPPSSRLPGPMYSGREGVTRNGDLVIRPSALNDTGNYTVQVDLGNETQTATGWLQIIELKNPGISANASYLVEDMDSVVAVCHTNATIVKWYVNSIPTSSSNRMTISPDGKTLVIHRVSRYDRTLHCETEHFLGITKRSELISLNVSYGPDYVTLWGTPSIFMGALTAQPGSQVELTCSAHSRPPPAYRWLHNGSLLGSADTVTLPRLAWEQMGSYRCIVENRETQLVMYRDVRIQPPRKCPLSPGTTTPVVHSGFHVSGTLAVFLIVMTVLGSVYLCGVLVHILISHYSTRTTRAT
ncbi:carcinoembryonic antigen-related cell adhesion molecule 18 [Tupaia chinensis]|uniref:carcinoembryonic antigen-related cell adhesion molecule 18 n=1 Tax=Tupaia chinensis TaxID=246437 RepID=UPI000704458A|nr:carcinoembryonic antigen-related cell adhesion molecule 18 [Tupaia chinensis]